MKRHLIVAAVVAVIGLAGCATATGTKVAATDVTFIQKGKTTKSELVQKLGQPNGGGIDTNGKETMTWIHARAEADAKTLIPVLGAFIGSSTYETTTLKVILDKRGVVSDYEYNVGRQVSKMGG
ncbi:hypothetical protein Dsui_2603 [Azospira oryzae PS]|jgi:outer membrane protein assembly factor BamE (lipoprotein component of BamABCDE complex)|uniref:Lipoprotein SmpA/OmlA domain-containing protein n=1 Tax=Azospira oryzae (strain ATCC BAA-33 / DSM 13638 / PS) TaxID=640081 RepID=G8QNR0_AZOOP|nr:hypothetical protein [Azospira oryzae]AEV26954.1 hypothetical protein Dsui_2603 [Azospira oryzae PS]